MGKEIDIDFVLPWVDGSDPAWVAAFSAATGVEGGDGRCCRYRDWELLPYLFRGFEKFTPWVRKIHFVTWGHLPPWLNTDNPKLNIVNHSDFIDAKYLPIFSCNPIEINLHRINGLAERFIYFNDDTFILKGLNEDYFFSDGKPRDLLAFNAIYDSPIAHIKINDVKAINRHFVKTSVVRRNFFKIFNLKYSLIEIVKTLLLLPWPKLTGFFDPHQPQPYLKKTFFEVWNKEKEILEKTSATKIRSSLDVNQYLFRYWQLCSGNFCARSFDKTFSKMIETDGDADEFCEKIYSNRYEMVCINDNIENFPIFERSKRKLIDTFESIFPEKSTFEK